MLVMRRPLTKQRCSLSLCATLLRPLGATRVPIGAYYTPLLFVPTHTADAEFPPLLSVVDGLPPRSVPALRSEAQRACFLHPLLTRPQTLPSPLLVQPYDNEFEAAVLRRILSALLEGARSRQPRDREDRNGAVDGRQPSWRRELLHLSETVFNDTANGGVVDELLRYCHLAYGEIRAASRDTRN